MPHPVPHVTLLSLFASAPHVGPVLRFVAPLALVSALSGCATTNALPVTPAAESEPPASLEERAIERQPICIGSAVNSAGHLADTLYYRAAQMPDGKLAVGYFAFFSEERPWGNNVLTWTVLPALAIDMVYSHGLLFAPGYQRLASGKGDVEGVRVLYDLQADGSLALDRAVADDGTHDPVYLAKADIMRLDPQRPTFYTNVWSHQLGGRGVTSKADLAYVTCFGPGQIRPLPESIAQEFAVRRRASPAHVEALGGHPVGGPSVAAQAHAPRVPGL